MKGPSGIVVLVGCGVGVEAIAVGVAVPASVAVEVPVDVAVAVAVAAGVGVPVTVGVAVSIAVAVAVGVAVSLAAGVASEIRIVVSWMDSDPARMLARPTPRPRMKRFCPVGRFNPVKVNTEAVGVELHVPSPRKVKFVPSVDCSKITRVNCGLEPPRVQVTVVCVAAKC